jgi:hypothetical protein
LKSVHHVWCANHRTEPGPEQPSQSKLGWSIGCVGNRGASESGLKWRESAAAVFYYWNLKPKKRTILQELLKTGKPVVLVSIYRKAFSFSRGKSNRSSYLKHTWFTAVRQEPYRLMFYFRCKPFWKINKWPFLGKLVKRLSIIVKNTGRLSYLMCRIWKFKSNYIDERETEPLFPFDTDWVIPHLSTQTGYFSNKMNLTDDLTCRS